MLKKDKLRYNEYFDMQSIFDELYQQSRNNNNFYKLMEVIGSKQNIRLAYRNLKGNTGSKTKGTDGKTIEDISKLNDEMLIKEVRARLEDYNPLPVRRVYIPKPGSDKKRPLGIPTIWDRLIQQCILQVLEPICEPKFHNHSYGFRPNRSTHHAVSRMVSLINLGKHYYCVDIDIKGFFDNVNHGKLMKQAENFAEYYRAANVTLSARFCLDDIQLGHFLQGFYNDSKEFRFDKEASSSECVAKLKEIGMTDKGWVDDFNLHYEMENRSFERGQTFHNFNDHDYMVLEALSPRNLVVMDMKSGSLTIALGATEYKRYPKDEKPTKDNTTIGVSWEHGIYLGSTLSTTNFKAYKREYGTPEKIEDIYDYRAKLKQKFYFYQDMSKDDDVPKKLQNDFLHQMYEDFGTIEEDCFYDRLEDGKYDEGFKERQVKEEKSR